MDHIKIEPQFDILTSLDRDMIILELLTSRIIDTFGDVLKSVNIYKSSRSHLDDYKKERDILACHLFSDNCGQDHKIKIVRSFFILKLNLKM